MDREKLPLDQSDLVFEKKIEVGSERDVGRVMSLVDGLLEGGEEDDEGATDGEDVDDGGDVGAVLDSSGLKISYIKVTTPLPHAAPSPTPLAHTTHPHNSPIPLTRT